MPTDVLCVHPWSHGTHRGDCPVHATLWSVCQVWWSCNFSFTKAPRYLKMLISASNAIGRWGDHCWIVAGMSAEPKQLIHASQIAAHKTLSAPESPLSLCYVTDREREREKRWVGLRMSRKLEQLLFRSMYRKLISACVFKAVMADWNRSNHFDTPCIKYRFTRICSCRCRRMPTFPSYTLKKPHRYFRNTGTCTPNLRAPQYVSQ